MNRDGYPTGREVAWSQQYHRMTLSQPEAGEKEAIRLNDLGMRMVNRMPLYDNGLYFVIDNVADVQFTVLRWSEDERGVQPSPLWRGTDKYEAIRQADYERELEMRL